MPIRQSGWLPYFAYHKHPQHFAEYFPAGTPSPCLGVFHKTADISRLADFHSAAKFTFSLSKMSAGQQGLIGLIGPRGHAGRDGDQGPRGNDGERGQRGEPGELLLRSQSAYTHVLQGGAATSETAVRKVIRENAANGGPEETAEHPETAATGDPEASVVKPRNPCTGTRTQPVRYYPDRA